MGLGGRGWSRCEGGFGWPGGDEFDHSMISTLLQDVMPVPVCHSGRRLGLTEYTEQLGGLAQELLTKVLHTAL